MTLSQMKSDEQVSSVELSAEVRRIIATWSLLLGLTVITTWMVVMEQDRPWLIAATFGLVSVKVLAVFWEFMELRHAPPFGRWLFGGWAVALCLILAFMVTG